MTVIINEFEAVTEPYPGETPASGTSPAEGQSAAQANVPAPGEIERILLYLAERLARIAA